MTPQLAQELIKGALIQVAPDADLTALPLDADFRDILELDSLDFLNYVQTLSEASGYRIEEDDYPAFTTVAGGASFLAAHAGAG
ncbi:acyl carrier protein [Streptosporangium roseum]|uniref:acyl carrier protein n=1 Tax=Streptosporangium roseum TaxID=2001 RepID=UPI0004CD42C4|nr:acyl carrier protein [Streptosporangium roseum]